MYSDTHFHFTTLTQRRGYDSHLALQGLLDNDCFFAQDIGTQADDLPIRQNCIQNAINTFSLEQQKKLFSMIYFSCGVWPEKQSVINRVEQVQKLQKNIQNAKNSNNPFFTKIFAVGECGLDYHTDKNDLTFDFMQGQKDLFCRQIDLAKRLHLPFIVHTRDAFLDTLECLKTVGYHFGVIHCFSYGIEEAYKFLDLGYYISFSGSITYTKKRDLENKKKLLLSVPKNRLLFETDAPFLAPIPKRGGICTPFMTKYVVDFCASLMAKDPKELSDILDSNIKDILNKLNKQNK